MAARSDNPLPGALRSRLHRARQRKGRRVYSVEADGDTFWALEIAGLLPSGDDKAEIGRALTRALAEWAREKISERVSLTTGARP